MNPFQGGRAPGTQGGLGRMWRGKVTRIGLDGFPRVEIEKLARGFEFKCEDYSVVTVIDTGGAHIQPLAAGMEVVVGFLGPDEPVILGRKV